LSRNYACSAADGSASFAAECPGIGECERITGVGDGTWTVQEMWEEASPGCERRCQMIRQKSESEEDVDAEDESEIKLLVQRIESLVDEFRAFYSPDYREKLSYVESEGVIYWRKIESIFEREIGIKLRIVAEGFLKKT